MKLTVKTESTIHTASVICTSSRKLLVVDYAYYKEVPGLFSGGKTAGAWR